MPQRKPYHANVPGDFYVEDGCCTMCGVPMDSAPNLFGVFGEPRGYSQCFVKCQPTGDAELDQMIEAIERAELACIRYRGRDREILRRLVEAGESAQCDNLGAEREPET